MTMLLVVPFSGNDKLNYVKLCEYLHG
jgi:hypothetical protein